MSFVIKMSCSKCKSSHCEWHSDEIDGLEYVASINKAIQSNTFHILNLHACQVTDDKLEALLAALNNNQTIHTLKLANNDITNVGARHLADALKSNASWCTLDLRNNEIEESGYLALITALMQNQTLHTLELEECMLSQTCVEALGQLLKVNDTIQSLVLLGKYRYDAYAINPRIITSLLRFDITPLAEALKVNRTLCRLLLMHYRFDGEQALSNALACNHTLQSLDLQDCGLDARILAPALKVNHALRSLNMSFNFIGRDGLLAMVEALKINTTLCHLDLEGNMFQACSDVQICYLLRQHNGALESCIGCVARWAHCDHHAWLARNGFRKQSTKQATEVFYKTLRFYTGLPRDIVKLLSQYLYATRGQICWLPEPAMHTAVWSLDDNTTEK